MALIRRFEADAEIGHRNSGRIMLDFDHQAQGLVSCTVAVMNPLETITVSLQFTTSRELLMVFADGLDRMLKSLSGESILFEHDGGGAVHCRVSEQRRDCISFGCYYEERCNNGVEVRPPFDPRWTSPGLVFGFGNFVVHFTSVGALVRNIRGVIDGQYSADSPIDHG